MILKRCVRRLIPSAFEDLLLGYVPGLWRDPEETVLGLSKNRTRRHQQRLLQKAEASICDKLTIVVFDWLSGDLQNVFKYSEHDSDSKCSEDCTVCQEVLRFTTEAASAARALFDLSVADRHDNALLKTQFCSYMLYLEPACLKLDEARIRAHPDQRSTRYSQAEFLAMVRAPEQLHDDVKAPLVATFGSKENSSRCNNEATDEAYSRATLALLAAYQRALPKEAGNTLLVTCIRDSLATLRLEEATSSARHSVVHRPWNLLGDFKWSKSDPAEYQRAKDYLISVGMTQRTQHKTTEEW